MLKYDSGICKSWLMC